MKNMSVFDFIAYGIGYAFIAIFTVLLPLMIKILKNVVSSAFKISLFMVKNFFIIAALTIRKNNQSKKDKDNEKIFRGKNRCSEQKNIKLGEVHCYESSVKSNGVTTMFMNLNVNDISYLIQVDYHKGSLKWFGLGNKTLQKDFTTEEITEILSLLNNHFKQKNIQIPEKSLVI